MFHSWWSLWFSLQVSLFLGRNYKKKHYIYMTYIRNIVIKIWDSIVTTLLKTLQNWKRSLFSSNLWQFMTELLKSKFYPKTIKVFHVLILLLQNLSWTWQWISKLVIILSTQFMSKKNFCYGKLVHSRLLP